MQLTKYQNLTLEYLASCGGGGFSAGTLAREAGCGSSRSQMAVFRFYELLPLFAGGLIDKIDAEKPIVWVITDAGRATLAEKDQTK